MVYISEGRVVESRSWSLRIIPDFVWGIVNAVTLFFRTLIEPNLNSSGRSYSANGNQGGWRNPPGMSRRRMGGIGSTADCSSAPMPGGG